MKLLANSVKLPALTMLWVVLSFNAIAATTYNSKATGAWNNTGTWNPAGIPVAGDIVRISGNFPVTIPSGYTAACASINMNYDFCPLGGNITFTDATSILNVSGNFVMTPHTNSNATQSITMNGGTLTVGGSFTATSDYKSDTKKYIQQILFTGGGTITVTGAISLTSDNTLAPTVLNMTGGGTLNVGSSITLNSGKGTFTSGTGTVNYTGTGQTLLVDTYYNLTLSGGAETFGAITTINGTLTLSGSATATTAANLAIGVNLVIGNGTTFTVAGFTLNVTGTTTVGGGTSGSLQISSATGTKTFTGNVTINNGATLSESAAATLSFGGDVTINNGGTLTENGAAVVGIAGSLLVNGAYTASTGVHTFSGATKTIGGTTAVVIPSVTVNGTYTNNNTLTVSTALSGSGGLTQAASATLNIGGTSGISALTATASSNTVNFTGASQTVNSNNYYHLTLSGSGTDILQTGTTTISGNLTLTGTLSTTTVVGLAISGNLSIGNGTALNVAG
ncbi:MAG: hypothetical protein PHD97_12395, partial [Bacteroidales bacterium]|nr:hypothetical protein [Bacteroidales bacterium]